MRIAPWRAVAEGSEGMLDRRDGIPGGLDDDLHGRVCDERVALDLNVLGQETTGPGGLAFALRTVPAMVGIARKNENSVAALLSAPNNMAPTIVAPARDTPGTMERHCIAPIPKYIGSVNLVAS